MSMGAENSRNFPVQKAAERNFLARGLAMNINHDDGSFGPHFLHRRLHDAEWIFEDWEHEGAALHIDYTHFALGSFQYDRALPRSSFRVIDWAQQARFGLDERRNLLLIPDVIPRGNNGNPRTEQIDRDFSGYAATAGRVLTVYDNKIDPVFLFQLRQP